MKQRNPFFHHARTRKAGIHTSTAKKRGGKRGGNALKTEWLNELHNYYESKFNETTKKDKKGSNCT